MSCSFSLTFSLFGVFVDNSAANTFRSFVILVLRVLFPSLTLLFPLHNSSTFFFLSVAQIKKSSWLVLIQSSNRHAIRAKVNKPSDANVYCAMSHDTASVLVTYVSQITHGNQIDKRKQTYWKNKVHWVKQTIKTYSNFPFGKSLSSRHTAWMFFFSIGP